jgi:hypothetical protein
MRISFIAAILILVVSSISKAQNQYPFMETTGNEDILAYWYNVERDSVYLKRFQTNLQFHSAIQIYGKAPGDSFSVNARAYLNSGEKIFDQDYVIRNGKVEKPNTCQMRNGFFKLDCPVNYTEQKPARIVISIKSSDNERTKEITCRYHKVYGNITDFSGKPFRAFVGFGADTFLEYLTVWSDSSGYYEIELPERTYNTVGVDDESYSQTTLEAWGWNIIVDSDQRLDFKVGTGEVYNLNAWVNNGGPPCYFITFRPMALIPRELWEARKYDTEINEKEWRVSGLAPELNIEDIRISVNGKEVEIYSLQKYYETAWNGTAMPAYLVQVSKDGLDRVGKQTIRLEYEKEMEINGQKVLRNSMGYFQFYLNYGGLSTYY